MEVVSPFGFVTGCHAGDKFMVQATLASMRHYCPEVPIALVVDGSFNVRDLEDRYGIITLRVDNLPSPEMRQFLSRSLHAKHVPMWEGPFEFYVWMDSDAIVWGDFTKFINYDVDFHIFRSEKDAVVSLDSKENPFWLKHFLFDPNMLQKFDRNFCWKETKFFCPGVFAARRNAIPFQKYAEAILWNNNNPRTFMFGDMGIINYLVHSMEQNGKMKIAFSDLQDMWSNNGKEELVTDCIGTGWRFPKTIGRPRVAHFCGRKPHLFDWKSYSKPFTIARLEHYRKINSNLGAWGRVLFEEFQILSRKTISKMSRKIFSH